MNAQSPMKPQTRNTKPDTAHPYTPLKGVNVKRKRFQDQMGEYSVLLF